MLQGTVRRRLLPRWVLALGDLLLVNTGIFLAFYARFGMDLPYHNYAPYRALAPWISVAALVFFAGLRLYEAAPVPFVDSLRSLFLGNLFLMSASMALTFWFRGFAFPRSVLLLGGLLQFVLLAAWRVGFWHLERRLCGNRHIMIVAGVGAPPTVPAAEGGQRASAAEGGRGLPVATGEGGSPVADDELALISKLLNVPSGWYRIHSMVRWNEDEALQAGLGQVDAVLLAPSVPATVKARLASLALGRGREVHLVPELYEILLLNARVGQVDDLPVVEISSLGLTPLQEAAKRLLDVFVAAAGLAAALPLMLVIAALVRLTSPGPVLFRQERVGRGGRVFTLYKFRSMVQDAEADTGPVLAAAADPRVTPVGRLLRATRLDELPQLFNILKGDMSLVGPRPERPFFVEQYASEFADYRYRLLVKPGLTGLAQVMGRYSTGVADKLRYDLYYIRNYSFFLDLKLLLQTLSVVFRGGAARGVDYTAVSGLKEQAAAVALLQAGRRLTKGCGGAVQGRSGPDAAGRPAGLGD